MSETVPRDGVPPPQIEVTNLEAVADATTAAPGETEPHLGRAMGRGLSWSLLNNVLGRLLNFASGVVVVRILAPEQYGAYAVGLVVLTVLLSMNELGVSVAVVQRTGSVDDIAPTVTTLSILSSTVLAAAAFLAAPGVAAALHTPEASGVIRLLLVGVLLDGISSVPNALITRAFAQRTRLLIDTCAFVTGTPVTIALAATGHGAWSLAWGAVVGNLTTAVLGVLWAPARYRPGWNRAVVPELLGFGLPLAASSLLLLAMLNVDYVVVGHRLGTTSLGLYLLAFNLCSWPLTVITTAVRRVSLAAFARMKDAPDGGADGFVRTAALVFGVTVPVCILLAAYAGPLVTLVYGKRWEPAAAAVRFLAVLSFGRIAVELTYDFLAATGRARSTVWLHGTWLVALVPALIVGAGLGGIRGVAVGHAVVVAAVVLPTLIVLLHRAGVPTLGLLRACRPVLVAGAALGLTCVLAVIGLRAGSVQLVLGVTVGGLVYLAFAFPLWRTARSLVRMTG